MKENRKAKIFETREEIAILYNNSSKALGRDHLQIFEESIYLYLKANLDNKVLKDIDWEIIWNKRKDLSRPINKLSLRQRYERKLAFFEAKYELIIWDQMRLQKDNSDENAEREAQNKIDEELNKVSREIESIKKEIKKLG